MQTIIHNKDLSIIQVTLDQSSILQNLMELYCYDFTEYMNLDLADDGLFHYPLEAYWNSPDTHRTYFIKVDGILAGCILQYSYISDEGIETQTIGEFFVLKKYRHFGIGTAAAKIILNEFPGNWLIYQSSKNIPAQTFWRRIISEITDKNYKEYVLDEKPHQTFVV